MNCPSRTDSVTLEHPTWNQNPPFLAADLTTCEDLNGTVNAREHRNGGGGDGSLAGGSLDEKDYHAHPPLIPDRLRAWTPGRWNLGFHPRSSKDVLGGEDQPRPSPPIPQQATRSKAWGWIAWTVSVLVCSTLLSAATTTTTGPEGAQHGASVSVSGSGLLSSFFRFSSPTAAAAEPVCPPPHASSMIPAAQAQGLSEPPSSYPSLSPLVVGHAHAKRSTCGSGGVDVDEYNVPMQVGALFIMLAVSFLSCAFALIAKHFPFIRVPSSFFFAVRHFGTGVLLATAFVHLLPTAFILLGDDCLSSFWIDDYDAMPGAIALAAVFFVAIIEMIFQPARQLIQADGGTSTAGPEMAQNRREYASAAEDTVDDETHSAADAPASNRRMSATTNPNPNPATTTTATERGPMEMGPLHGASHNLGRQLSRLSHDAGITRTLPNTNTNNNETEEAVKPSRHHHHLLDPEDGPVVTASSSPNNNNLSFHPYILTPAQRHQKEILQCMMLEVGILFHSVFIGMTLAVSVGSNFIVLLVAIVFHQTFEGLALGSRIAAINWHPGALQPWLMALAYGCTTPLGQALGIATHRLYDPDSEFGLVLVGTMNAISSGLLVFASLVELLSEDFLSDESWRVLRGGRRVVACLLVFGGAFGMSVVGAWA